MPGPLPSLASVRRANGLAVSLVAALLAGPEAAAVDPPHRVVALAPSAAEIVYALGAADRVVGVSDFAADLPESKGKTLVGGFSPDLERIAALKPDLAVVSRDGTDRRAATPVKGRRAGDAEGGFAGGYFCDERFIWQVVGCIRSLASTTFSTFQPRPVPSESYLLPLDSRPTTYSLII